LISFADHYRRWTRLPTVEARKMLVMNNRNPVEEDRIVAQLRRPGINFAASVPGFPCSIGPNQIVNCTALATYVGISPNTVRSWLSILESSYILYLLQLYHRNFNRRLVKESFFGGSKDHLPINKSSSILYNVYWDYIYLNIPQGGVLCTS